MLSENKLMIMRDNEADSVFGKAFSILFDATEPLRVQMGILPEKKKIIFNFVRNST